MILKRETEAGEIVVDTKNVSVLMKGETTHIHISNLITPTYKEYEEADICCLNETEGEVEYLIKLLFPFLKEKNVKINLVEGDRGYTGAKIILT